MFPEKDAFPLMTWAKIDGSLHAHADFCVCSAGSVFVFLRLEKEHPPFCCS